MPDTQGRDNVTRLELALDNELHFLGLSVANIANMGLPVVFRRRSRPGRAGLFSGVYVIPAIHVAVEGVTHTVPVDAYRGAGRPEARIPSSG